MVKLKLATNGKVVYINPFEIVKLEEQDHGGVWVDLKSSEGFRVQGSAEGIASQVTDQIKVWNTGYR